MKLFGREIKGLAEAVVIFAMIFLVSSSLCGLQLRVFDKALTYQGLLMASGVAELAGILLGGGGLIVCLVIWLILVLKKHFTAPRGNGADDNNWLDRDQ